jgi:hypothetical protein
MKNTNLFGIPADHVFIVCKTVCDAGQDPKSVASSDYKFVHSAGCRLKFADGAEWIRFAAGHGDSWILCGDLVFGDPLQVSLTRGRAGGRGWTRGMHFCGVKYCREPDFTSVKVAHE